MAPPPDDPDDDAVTPRHPTAAELERHRRTVPGGIPVVGDPEPIPEPDIEWPNDPDRVDAEVLHRAGRDPGEPTMPAETSALVRQIARRLREEFSRQLTDAPPAVNKRLARLERDFEPHRRFGKYVAGIAFGAAIAIGIFLYHRGQDEQRVTDRLDRLEADFWRFEHPQQPTGPRP